MHQDNLSSTQPTDSITPTAGWSISPRGGCLTFSGTNPTGLIFTAGNVPISYDFTDETNWQDCWMAAANLVEKYRQQAPPNFDPQNKGASVPDPPPPPKPPAPSTAHENLLKRRSFESMFRKRGYSSTILTGGLGTPSTIPSPLKSLLGS